MILPEHLIRVKELLPTTLGSDAIREQYASDILRRSIFSARMESARYLARIRDVCADIAAGRISTGGARGELIRVLNDM